MVPFIGDRELKVRGNDAIKAGLYFADSEPLKTVGELPVDSETRFMFHLLDSGLKSNGGKVDGWNAITYRKLKGGLIYFNLDALIDNSDSRNEGTAFSLVVKKLFNGDSAKRSLWTISPNDWLKKDSYRLIKRNMTGKPAKPKVSAIIEEYIVIIDGHGRAIEKIK